MTIMSITPSSNLFRKKPSKEMSDEWVMCKHFHFLKRISKLLVCNSHCKVSQFTYVIVLLLVIWNCLAWEQNRRKNFFIKFCDTQLFSKLIIILVTLDKLLDLHLLSFYLNEYFWFIDFLNSFIGLMIRQIKIICGMPFGR